MMFRLSQAWSRLVRPLFSTSPMVSGYHACLHSELAELGLHTHPKERQSNMPPQQETDVFLIYATPIRFHHTLSAKRFFGQAFTQLLSSTRYPIFFSSDEALSHVRRLDVRYGVLRLRVPTSSVVGSTATLSLRLEKLHATQIHGCYLSRKEEPVYFENPGFQRG